MTLKRKIYRKCHRCHKRIEILSNAVSHSKIVCKECVYKNLGIPISTMVTITANDK